MSENFYMQHDFDDFNTMAEALLHWDIEVRQLEKGMINNTFALGQLKVNNIYLAYAEFTGKTQQIGHIPPGRTFAFHRAKAGQLNWRKKDVPINGLMIFPLDSKLDVVTKGELTVPYTISVSEDVLVARLTNSEKEIYKQIVSTQHLLLIPKPEMKNLQDTFDKYFQSLEEDPELIHLKNFQVCFEEELLSALIAALFSNYNDDSEISYHNSTIWKKLEIYIETYKHRPIRVSELTQTAEISERSLYRLFHERFSITPKAYLDKLRLNGVRLDLIKSSGSDTKIHHIANVWGFWHMGKFAADYKYLFGELPSETLHSA